MVLSSFQRDIGFSTMVMHHFTSIHRCSMVSICSIGSGARRDLGSPARRLIDRRDDALVFLVRNRRYSVVQPFLSSTSCRTIARASSTCRPAENWELNMCREPYRGHPSNNREQRGIA